jgi:hypothetical protein
MTTRTQPETDLLSVRCPTCGAGPGEKCELTSGQPRTTPHRDRRVIAQKSETFGCDGKQSSHAATGVRTTFM